MSSKKKTVLDLIREAAPTLTDQQAEAVVARLGKGFDYARQTFKSAKKLRVIIESSPCMACVADYAVRVGDVTLKKVEVRPVEDWEMADFAAGHAIVWPRWEFVQKPPKGPAWDLMMESHEDG